MEQGITRPCVWSIGIGVSIMHTLQDQSISTDDVLDGIINAL